MRITIENKMTRTLWPSKFLKMKEIMEMEKEEHREKEIFASGFWNSFEKKFRTWPKSVNFAKFRPKFIFRLFLKILLNIFKLLFLKFSNFGGGEITEFGEISLKFRQNFEHCVAQPQPVVLLARNRRQRYVEIRLVYYICTIKGQIKCWNTLESQLPGTCLHLV